MDGESWPPIVNQLRGCRIVIGDMSRHGFGVTSATLEATHSPPEPKRTLRSQP